MNNLKEIMDELRPMIVDCLSVELEEVTDSARLIEDLGAESIDILELAFRCDKQFNARIPLQEMAAPTDLETDATGRLTPEALAKFKSRFPFLDYTQFEQDPVRDQMTVLLTVEAMARLVAYSVREVQVDSGEVPRLQSPQPTT